MGGQPVPANAVYTTGTSSKGTPLCSARVSSASGGSLTVVDATSTVLFRAPTSPVTPAAIDTIASGGTLGQSLNLYSLNALYWLVVQVIQPTFCDFLIMCSMAEFLPRFCMHCLLRLLVGYPLNSAACCSLLRNCRGQPHVLLMGGHPVNGANAGCQGDGNLVFYSLASGTRTATWAAGTYGLSMHTPFRLQMQTVRPSGGKKYQYSPAGLAFAALCMG